MKSFVACARVSAYTIIFTLVSFQVFAILWSLTLGLEGFRLISVYSLLWLNQWTTAFIGFLAGFLTPRYERERPLLIAAISAALVELLHASASGAFRLDHPLKTSAITALCAALAAGAAWLRMRLTRPSLQGEAK